jgi:hypothetical protein
MVAAGAVGGSPPGLKLQCGQTGDASSSCSVSAKQLFRPGQAVLKIRQVPARHQVDGRELLQVLEPFVAHELGLALVLVHAETRFGVHGEVSRQVRLLEVAELALGLPAEGGQAPLGRIADLG